RIWVGSDSLIAKLVIQTIGTATDPTIPVAAEFGVSPGARITTDATMYNKGTAGVSGDILYLYSPAAFAARTTFSVDGGQAVFLSDVLGGTSSNAGGLLGPVRIRCTSGDAHEPSVTRGSARQLDDGSSFGFASAAATAADSVGGGGTRVLFLGGRSSESDILGLYSPEGGVATAKLLAPDGTVRGTTNFAFASNVA